MKRALISVSDKTGIVEFVKGLSHLGFEITASEGTAKTLKEAGISVMTVSEITGFPEILDGRVKTLHPKIYGGILCRRDGEERELKDQGILPFDLVVCNFYPLTESNIQPASPSGGHPASRNLVERIDIGGPAMVRAAAKNYENVAVVTSPDQYEWILKEFEKNGGALSEGFRHSLAQRAFEMTRNYDSAIANRFQDLKSTDSKIQSDPPDLLAQPLGLGQSAESDDRFPNSLELRYEKITNLRYGENPQQRAAFYRDPLSKPEGGGLATAKQYQGKTLSYNNLLDFDAALNIVREFDSPAAVIIKHSNPCGVGKGENITDAYRLAHLADPISAFGGIVGLNRTCDEETAREIITTFLEGVIASGFTEDGLKIFREKKNLRVLECDIEISETRSTKHEARSIRGGLLLQESNYGEEDPVQWEIVTRREPTKKERAALNFAWKVVRHVKSNGIVLAIQNRTIGIGAGQMSRIDAVELAIRKARGVGSFTGGTVMATDGFFPFRDAIDLAAREGITAVIQPGGSIRDREVIQACIEQDIAMLFTKTRYFKH
ncbi:bifunctional phosphoribosylaminoimidazolecarboxamide formyltransferase/IMP cyclohydrolase [candidate division TA06 bacterium]|nr:bifunctional phosphoribosylaminoimidazolecarboxamide formyltransferase/IMP cyclohydrolase [candidate division TA06 bacterium]